MSVDVIFGARAQIIVGAVLTTIAIGIWVFYSFFSTPTVGVVFQISMLFGVAATYAIVATGLGYRKTEHVESAVADIDITESDVSIQDGNGEEDTEITSRGKGGH